MKTLRVLPLLLLVGCATGSQLTTVDPQSSGKNYTIESHNIFARQVLKEGNRRCPTNDKEVEKATWRMLVDYAATCAAKEKWSQVESFAQTLADRFPTGPWGFYFLSLAADARGDVTRAFWMLEQASEKDKGLALFPYQRGRLYLKNGETENAVSEFEKALKLDADLYEADLFIGQIRLRGGNFSGAERSFRNVLKAEPFHRDALMGAARCLVNSGDSKLAVDFFERVIGKNKKDFEARFERAVILESVFQKYEDALVEYQALLALADNKQALQRRIENLEKTLKTRKVAGGKR